MAAFVNLADFPLAPLLNAVCSVWKKSPAATVDGYGIQHQVFILVATDIRCRVDPGDGKELNSDVAFGIQNYTFYMRPQLVDTPAVPLNIHHWLQLNGVDADGGFLANLIVDPPDPNGTMFDIKNIKNPGLLNHHLEIVAQLLEP